MIFEIDSGSVGSRNCRAQVDVYIRWLCIKIRRIDRHAFSELRNKSRLPNNIFYGSLF